MKIMELCLSSALGGLELYFDQCCVELQQRGHELVSVRQKNSRLLDLGKKNNLKLISLNKGNKYFPLWRAWRLARIISKHQVELVHAHHSDDLPLIALTKKICRRPFKLVFTRQMPLPHHKRDFYHQWIYAKVDLFITITELLKKDALEKLPMPAARIQRLYYGVSLPPARDEKVIREFLNFSGPGDFNIGVFSRLEFQKGQHVIIPAIKKLIDKKIPARLYIVGSVMDNDYKESLVKQIIDLKLQDAVALKGFLTQPRLAMLGLDVLVLPSRREAFGLVLIEAMRSNIAVIGTGSGGVPEIIDHNKTGLLSEWNKPDLLADQLEYLYENPTARAELAAQGKQKADKEFSNELHFKNLERLFMNTAHSNQG